MNVECKRITDEELHPCEIKLFVVKASNPEPQVELFNQELKHIATFHPYAQGEYFKFKTTVIGWCSELDYEYDDTVDVIYGI